MIGSLEVHLCSYAASSVTYHSDQMVFVASVDHLVASDCRCSHFGLHYNPGMLEKTLGCLACYCSALEVDIEDSSLCLKPTILLEEQN